MTLHDFFLGGSTLRVTFFCVGIAYCVKQRRTLSIATLTLAGSVVVLALLVFSREWATFAGIPVTILAVERITETIRLEAEVRRWRSLGEDQHAINEQLVTELRELQKHRHT